MLKFIGGLFLIVMMFGIFGDNPHDFFLAIKIVVAILVLSAVGRLIFHLWRRHCDVPF